MSLDTMMKEEKGGAKKNTGDNKGGKGGKFRNAAKQGGRPRYNDSKNNTRSALFKPQKTGNQITKDRGGPGNRGGRGGSDRVVSNKVRAKHLNQILTLCVCFFVFCR